MRFFRSIFVVLSLFLLGSDLDAQAPSMRRGQPDCSVDQVVGFPSKDPTGNSGYWCIPQTATAEHMITQGSDWARYDLLTPWKGSVLVDRHKAAGKIRVITAISSTRKIPLSKEAPARLVVSRVDTVTRYEYRTDTLRMPGHIDTLRVTEHDTTFVAKEVMVIDRRSFCSRHSALCWAGAAAGASLLAGGAVCLLNGDHNRAFCGGDKITQTVNQNVYNRRPKGFTLGTRVSVGWGR